MNFLQGIGLGILQGLTEFLPLSSSGHLVLVQAFLGIKSADSILFEVSVHFATLLAIILYYRKTLWHLFKSSKKSLQHKEKGSLFQTPETRFIFLILVACIPTFLIGFFCEEYLTCLFDNPKMTGGGLIVTAILLTSTLFRQKDQKDILKTTVGIALIIGIAQSIALVPGISRSGITISAALLMGMNRRLSADFSFLLALPAILGATLITINDLSQLNSIGFAPLIGGVVSSFIFGYLALSLLVRMVRQGHLYWFAPYCFILGTFSLIYFS